MVGNADCACGDGAGEGFRNAPLPAPSPNWRMTRAPFPFRPYALLCLTRGLQVKAQKTPPERGFLPQRLTPPRGPSAYATSVEEEP